MADFAGAAAAIRDRLTALRPAEVPVAWPNEKRPVTTDGEGRPAMWVYAEVAGTQSAIRGAGTPGDHVVVDDGLIIMTVFAPDGDGTAAAFALAGLLGEIFRVKQFYDAEPGACVRTWTPSISGGDAGSDDGLWFSVTVTIPFEFWRLA